MATAAIVNYFFLQLEGSTAIAAKNFNARLSELAADDAAILDQLHSLQPILGKLTADSETAAETVASLEGKVQVRMASGPLPTGTEPGVGLMQATQAEA